MLEPGTLAPDFELPADDVLRPPGSPGEMFPACISYLIAPDGTIAEAYEVTDTAGIPTPSSPTCDDTSTRTPA